MEQINNTKLKPRMTYEEMAEVFAEEYPALLPNRNLVGRFAKKIGYKWCKQMQDRELIFYYAQANLKTKI